MEQYKTCTKCGQIKERFDFPKDKNRKDGLHPQCKFCVNIRMRTYSQKNSEANRQRAATWYKANAKRAYEQSKKRRQSQADVIRSYQSQYRQRTIDQRKTYAANYFLANRAKFRNYALTRRSRSSSRFRVTDKELERLLAKPCLYCGAESQHIDHIIPLSRGGEHRIGNLTGACAPCNLSKSSKFVTEWRKGRNEAR